MSHLEITQPGSNAARVHAKVYVETTIVSYLAARASRDLIVAGHQQITREWWTHRRGDFGLFISEFVLAEARHGDPESADRRIALLREAEILRLTDDAIQLAEHLIDAAAIPVRAGTDALHIAMATVHGLEYLLTWNCRHIANAAMRGRIESACRARGYEPPVLCTPEELMG